MTVRDAQAWAQTELTGTGIDSPRRDVQLMLCWLLKCRREDLLRDPDRVLDAREELIFRKAIALRVLRRPVPYITGETYFHGLRFRINRAVLIPRPETEQLVECAVAHARGIDRPSIADIGTGSGCIAVSVAVALPHAQVTASDISPLALLLAKKNVALHGVQNRVKLLEGDLLGPLGAVRQHIIVSNPPYVRTAEINALEPEVRDYEPRLALDGAETVGEDGTALHARLMRDAPAHLTPGGWLIMEIGSDQSDAILEMAHHYGFVNSTVEPDFAGKPRMFVGQAPL